MDARTALLERLLVQCGDRRGVHPTPTDRGGEHAAKERKVTPDRNAGALSGRDAKRFAIDFVQVEMAEQAQRRPAVEAIGLKGRGLERRAFEERTDRLKQSITNDGLAAGARCSSINRSRKSCALAFLVVLADRRTCWPSPTVPANFDDGFDPGWVHGELASRVPLARVQTSQVKFAEDQCTRFRSKATTSSELGDVISRDLTR